MIWEFGSVAGLVEVFDITERAWPYLVFAALHLVLGEFGAAWWYRRRFGGNPLVIYQSPAVATPHMQQTRQLLIPIFVWSVSLILYALWPAFRETWQGAPLVDIPVWVGWSGGVVCLVGMLAAQSGMGRAFRVGQDERADVEPELVTGGMFSMSRNPVYVCSFLYLAFVSTWAPCPLLWSALALIGWGMHQLVLCEEAFLKARLGEAYEDYCARVPRYM